MWQVASARTTKTAVETAKATVQHVPTAGTVGTAMQRVAIATWKIGTVLLRGSI